MTVDIGTDPAVVVMRLQEQIDMLREDLKNHTHIFLTGRGTGHNNTEAETSSALIPLDESADDLDGVTSTDDLCPGTPEGVAVDENGCGIDAFCSLQERTRDCPVRGSFSTLSCCLTEFELSDIAENPASFTYQLMTRRFGGKMWIDSRPSGGTRITISIPRPAR